MYILYDQYFVLLQATESGGGKHHPEAGIRKSQAKSTISKKIGKQMQ